MSCVFDYSPLSIENSKQRRIKVFLAILFGLHLRLAERSSDQGQSEILFSLISDRTDASLPTVVVYQTTQKRLRPRLSNIREEQRGILVDPLHENQLQRFLSRLLAATGEERV